MTIRAPTKARFLLAAATACALAACSTQEEPAGMDPEEFAQVAEDCLLMVWGSQDTRDEAFDRANDVADGGAISCATGTSPSQFEAALKAIREAAKARDKPRMLAEIGIPMLYIDAKGERREMAPEAIDALFDEVFSEDMLARLENADLKDLTVIPSEGAYLELGSVWLVAEPGQRPRIVTVNAQALGEAAEAARRDAEADKGVEITEKPAEG